MEYEMVPYDSYSRPEQQATYSPSLAKCKAGPNSGTFASRTFSFRP